MLRQQRLNPLFVFIALAWACAGQYLFYRGWPWAGSLLYLPLCVYVVLLAPCLKLEPSPTKARPSHPAKRGRGLIRATAKALANLFSLPEKHPSLAAALGFSAALLLGALLRFYFLANIPYSLDERSAENALSAIGRGGEPFSPLLALADPHGTFHSLLNLSFALHGGHSVDALRLVATLVGILTLILVGLLCRELKLGAASYLPAMLMAISGWHIVYSRAGWSCILLPLAASLFVYLLLLAWRLGGRILPPLAGAALALNLYVHTSGRATLWLAIFALVLLHRRPRGPHVFLSEDRNGGRRGGQARHLLAAIISFFLFSLPLLIAMFSRNSGTIIGDTGLRSFLANLVHTAGIFNYRVLGPDLMAPGPLLQPLLALFLPLGLLAAVAATRFGAPPPSVFARRFILLWFACGLFPGLASQPNGDHNIAALVPVYFLAALGLESVLRLIFCRRPLARRCLLLLLVATCALFTFLRHLGPGRREPRDCVSATRLLAGRLYNTADNHHLYLSDEFHGSFALHFYLYRPGLKVLPPRYRRLSSRTRPAHLLRDTDRPLALVSGPSPGWSREMKRLQRALPRSQLMTLASSRRIAGIFGFLLIVPFSGERAGYSTPPPLDAAFYHKRQDLFREMHLFTYVSPLKSISFHGSKSGRPRELDFGTVKISETEPLIIRINKSNGYRILLDYFRLAGRKGDLYFEAEDDSLIKGEAIRSEDYPNDHLWSYVYNQSYRSGGAVLVHAYESGRSLFYFFYAAPGRYRLYIGIEDDAAQGEATAFTASLHRDLTIEQIEKLTKMLDKRSDQHENMRKGIAPASRRHRAAHTP